MYADLMTARSSRRPSFGRVLKRDFGGVVERWSPCLRTDLVKNKVE